jgi:hypothetical protein
MTIYPDSVNNNSEASDIPHQIVTMELRDKGA